MKKRKLLIGVLAVLILIAGYLLYQYIRVKTAKVEIVLSDNLQAKVYDSARVSSFIESINGKIIDDKKIDTKKVGKKKIEFEFINEQNIKLKQSFEIEVVDDEAPLVWLGKSYNVALGSKDNLLDKILCGDNYDAKPKCEIIGTYDLNEAGAYDLVFKASDSSGNETIKKFTLNVNKNSSVSQNIDNESYVLFNNIKNNYKNSNTQIGIDISKWQGDVDFKSLKEAGVEFVFLRVGTSINRENIVDQKFLENIKKAEEVDMPVGVYYYSYANSASMARSDALWVVSMLQNKDITLPVVFDWENWNTFNEFNLSFFGLSDVAKTFLDTVHEHGYDGLLYSSKTYLENIWLDIGYPVWLAHYTANTNYNKDYEYWQITSNGKVDGINGSVDIDIRYLD